MKLRLCFWSIVAVAFAVLLFFEPYSDADNEIFELRQVEVTYRSFFGGGYDPLITQNPYQPNRALGKELNLQVNTDLGYLLYWNNTIHSMTDHEVGTNSGQFRMVGLEIQLGVDIRKIVPEVPVSIGYYHYSRHLLDTEWGLGHWPVEDGIELKLRLYDHPSR